jgi:ABC-type Fe3+ transport system permease subunit
MDWGTFTNIAFAGVAVFGLVLTGIAIAAAARVRSPRMVLVATGFLLIAVQGLVVGVSLFLGGADPGFLLFVSALFEAALLLVLFLATLVR